MSSSRKWARFISPFAAFIYFSMVIFQVPLFRVPCRIGTCRSPLQVTSSQLIAGKLFPETAAKALLYPGAVAGSVLNKKAIPSYNDLLNSYESVHVKEVHAAMDLKRIEVLAGSYLMVAGSLMSIVKLFLGALLVTWAFCSMRKELRAVIRICKKCGSKAKLV